MGTHDKQVSRRLYQFKGGNLTVSDMPQSGFRFGDPDSYTVVRPGLENRTVEHVLPQAVDITARVAPWVTLFAGPRIVKEGGQQLFGRCHQPEGVVFVTTKLNASFVLQFLFHELFHAVDYYLSPADRAILDAAIDRGPAYASDYLHSPIERRARLFEWFASYVCEGGRLMVHPDVPEAALLWRIYAGEVGAEIFETMHSFDDIAAE